MTEPLTPEKTAELRRLLDAATPGPWRADGDAWIEAGSYDEVLTPAPVECMAYCYGGASRVNLADVDRALIVAAVNALPDILADLEDAESLTVALRLAQARAADAETEARLLKGEVRVWRDRALREERAGQQRWYGSYRALEDTGEPEFVTPINPAEIPT